MEHTAAELQVEEPTEGDPTPPKRPTRRADTRIEAERGNPMTFIDVAAHCSMAQCRGEPTPRQEAHHNQEWRSDKLRPWGLRRGDESTPDGKVAPATFELRGEYDPSLSKKPKDVHRPSRRSTATEESSRRPSRRRPSSKDGGKESAWRCRRATRRRSARASAARSLGAHPRPFTRS